MKIPTVRTVKERFSVCVFCCTHRAAEQQNTHTGTKERTKELEDSYTSASAFSENTRSEKICCTLKFEENLDLNSNLIK